MTTILRDNDWRCTDTCAPNSKLVPEKKIMGDKVPFGISRQLIIDVPVDPRVMVDVCIDGTIAFHESEPIPREEMTALAKLQEEAGLEESNMI